MRSRLAGAIAVSALAVLGIAYSVSGGSTESHAETSERAGSAAVRVEWSEAARAEALRRAAFWLPEPQLPLGAPADASSSLLSCRFRAEAPGGTTPKFECETEAGERLKVKYGGAEPHGEVAATELLRALGFPADHVTFVERIRCYGCPPATFLTAKALGFINALHLYHRRADYSAYREFEWAAVERRHPGVAIDTASGRGWGWYELKELESPPAHADGLRLMAVLLAHWDNKPENQRLVCLDDSPDALGREQCRQPVALLQDLGGTFGPRKVSLHRWRGRPIWADRESCLVSMEDLPHGGATFEPVRISEAGRQFAAARLATLTRARIRDLFERARFPQHDGERLEDWVRAFEGKVEQITAGPPCPAR